MKTLIEGNCETCNKPIRPANNQAQFNRNKGLHMWKVHNVPSRHRESPATPKRAYNRKSLNGHVANGNGLLQPLRYSQPAADPAVSAYLDQCPCCKTRFYMVKGVAA